MNLNRIILIVFVLGLGILPQLSSTPEFWITQLNYIGLAALVVLGLVLLTGVGGLTSFGQAAFVGLGAYATAYLTTAASWSPWLALLAGLVITFAVAFILGAITLRLSGHYLPLGTIAWCLSLYYLFGNLSFLGQYDGIAGIRPINLFGWSLLDGRDIFYLIWVFVFLSMWATRNLLDSRPGRAIRALKNGKGMAESFGVNMATYKVIIFVYSALLACVSGWLYAHMQRAVSPSPFGLNYGIEYLFMAVVGGGTSVWGAIMGSSLILLLKDQIQNVLPKLINTTSNFELVVFGVLMILVLQYARDGIWPIISGWWASITGQDQAMRKRGAPPAVEALPQRERPQAGTLVLDVDAARKQFGGLVAVNDISFKLKAGEIVGLIGPNGAGKSTMFNLLTGTLPLSDGTVSFMDEPTSGLTQRQIALRGVARTFQHVKLRPAMTVLENVALGAHARGHCGLWRGGLRMDREEEARIMAEAMRQLKRVGLADQAYELAGSLALGTQRLVEIARSLASDPVLIMLDEPAAGLRLLEKQALASLLDTLRSEGVTVLIVEHDMEFVMNLVDRLVVMNFGSKISEGRPDEVRADPQVQAAYLGSDA